MERNTSVGATLNITCCLALPKTPRPGPKETRGAPPSIIGRSTAAPGPSASSKSSSKREPKPGPNLRPNITAGSMDMDSWCGHGFLACSG